MLLALALLTLATGVAAAGPKLTVDLQILAVNDFHGALETTGSTGGAAYLATYVKDLDAANPNTIFVSGGDLVGASPLLSGIFHDEPTVEAFNLMGLDYATVGNHEFDEGVAELKRLQEGGCNAMDGCQDGDPFYGAEYKYLSANVIQTKNGQTLFSAYKLRSFMGVQVAFIGIALESTPGIVTAAGTVGVEFEPEVDVINATVARLKEDGVHAFVVIVHDSTNVCSRPSTNNLIDATDPDIDVFIMGHSHSTYACVYNGRTVSQAGSSGSYLTDVDLTLDRATGDVVARAVKNVRIVKANVTPDSDVQALINKYKALSDPLANRVIGSITADITRSGTESALGDVISDAMLYETAPAEKGGAVVSFMNPGGIRADLLYATISGGEKPGEVTYGEAFTVQPFSNNMVTMTMTGDQIKRLLESQYGSGCTKLQISNGFTYSVTQAAPQGSRISAIQINGVAIDPAASYRISTNNFLADGGDGCTIFTEGTSRLAGIIDLDALVNYFGAHSPVAPGPKNRITFLTLP